jgi:hypothetical protein
VDQFLAAHPPVAIASDPLLPSDLKELRRAAAELHVAPPTSHIPNGHFGAKTSPLFLLLGRLLYGGAAFVGLAALATLAGRRTIRDPGVIALGAMGLVFHALFLGTAIVELSLIRYTIPAWPIVCAILALIFPTLVSPPGSPPEVQPQRLSIATSE